jgi:hypothetical protein
MIAMQATPQEKSNDYKVGILNRMVEHRDSYIEHGSDSHTTPKSSMWFFLTTSPPGKITILSVSKCGPLAIRMKKMSFTDLSPQDLSDRLGEMGTPVATGLPTQTMPESAYVRFARISRAASIPMETDSSSGSPNSSSSMRRLATPQTAGHAWE